jgi:hypothetical protein
MDNLGWNDILKALAVIIAACGVIAAIWKGVEAFKRLFRVDERARQESAQDAAIADLNARMTRCEERLTKGDEQFGASRADMTQMLNIMNALLMHFISGNDHEKLREVKASLDSYLTQR